jgi:DNA adenine methylase
MGFSSKIGSWGFDKYGKRNKTFLNRKLNFDPSICDRLEHTQIECADALRVIKTYDCADAFHYIDPPYIDTHMGHYGGYSKDDYKALLDTLSTLKGKFLLSGFPNEMLEEYIQRNHWNIKSFEKPKTAAKATLGKPRTARKTEVLVANYTLQ